MRANINFSTFSACFTLVNTSSINFEAIEKCDTKITRHIWADHAENAIKILFANKCIKIVKEKKKWKSIDKIVASIYCSKRAFLRWCVEFLWIWLFVQLIVGCCRPHLSNAERYEMLILNLTSNSKKNVWQNQIYLTSNWRNGLPRCGNCWVSC